MFNNPKNTIIISWIIIILLFLIIFLDTNKKENKENTEILDNDTTIAKEELNMCKADSQDLLSILDTLQKERIEEEYHAVSSGQSLSLILSRNGFSTQEIHFITSEINKINKNLSTLKINQQYRVTHGYYGLMYIDIFIDTNRFIRIDKTEHDNISVRQGAIDYKTKHKSIQGTINNSLYLDGIKSGLTQRQIEEFSHIFAWDVDFSRNVHEGDEFKVVYEAHYDGNRIIGRGRIVAANIKTKTGNFYAFSYPDNGILRYFNENGESVEKAFLKAPVEAVRVTSRFTRSRYHPVLKRNRPHRGVDYGGALNTPIMVTADGIITRQRYENAYGNIIIVDHGQGYETIYAHMNKFNNDFKVGSSVKQGDIIGYMGTTGLSTGVHLHYELRLNGRHEDPLSIDLPNGEKVADIELLKDRINYFKSYWK